jgi:hypothetical protein
MTVSSVEMSVGLRSAARLLVLRGRADLALRRQSVASEAPFGDQELTTAADALDRIDKHPRCPACEQNSATGPELLSTVHSCVEGT